MKKLAYLIPFCVFGITYLLRYTTGPFNIFKKFRDVVGIHECDIIKNGKYAYTEEIIDDKFFAKLVSCFWCLSTWVSMGIVTFYVILLQYSLEWSILNWIVMVFSSVGVAGVTHSYVKEEEK